MGKSFSCVRDNSDRDYRTAYVPKSSNILMNGMQNEEKPSKTGGAKDLLLKERKGNFTELVSRDHPYTLGDSGFFYTSRYQGFVKATISGVFEDLSLLRQPTGQTQDNFNFGLSLLKF